MSAKFLRVRVTFCDLGDLVLYCLSNPYITVAASGGRRNVL